MAGKRYRAVRKRDRKGADVCGERFLSWHMAGERLPLDRTVLDYVYHHSNSIGGSTARRYGQFGERMIARLVRLDLRDLREEDIAAFVTAEFKDGRTKDPTINACVLLRSVMRAALAARDVYRRAHLAEDPLPRIAKIARRTVRKLWVAAKSTARDVYGVCLFQYSTGCRIGEALAMRWSAVDLERARGTIRLRIHAGEVGPVKTANSLRTIPIPQQLADYLRERPQQSP
jgi:integrase